MRVNYGVSFESFAGLEPAFQPVAPLAAGVRFSLALVIEILGAAFVLLFVHGASLLGFTAETGGSVVRAAIAFVLAAACLGTVWGWRKWQGRKTLREHTDFQRLKYGKLHCPNRRFVETWESGLLFGCDCGAQQMPWSGISTLLENERDFIIASAVQTEAVPKAAFASEAERTRFRALLSEKMTANKDLTARSVEFAYTAQDWRNAEWLQFKMGAWKRELLLAVMACWATGLSLVFLQFINDIHELTPAYYAGGVVFAAMLIAVSSAVRRPRVQTGIPFKVGFAEDAIYVESPVVEMRILWQAVTGCLADKKSLLFIHSRKRLLLIPLRSMAPLQGMYVFRMLSAKLAEKQKASGESKAQPPGS
jgi:hypothetical protein